MDIKGIESSAILAAAAAVARMIMVNDQPLPDKPPTP